MRTSVMGLLERAARTVGFASGADDGHRVRRPAPGRANRGPSPVALLTACVAMVVAGAVPAFATTYFNQDFQTNTTLSTYVGTGANQFDDIAGAFGGTASVVS